MNIWYDSLIKPPLTPPSEFFPISWGILYSLMAIAFFIVLSKPHSEDKYVAISLFLFQLVFNFTWSYVFLELHSINLALIDLICLLVTLLFTVRFFFKVSKVAGVLLIPYLLQVFFAFYLNIGLIILN